MVKHITAKILQKKLAGWGLYLPYDFTRMKLFAAFLLVVVLSPRSMVAQAVDNRARRSEKDDAVCFTGKVVVDTSAEGDVAVRKSFPGAHARVTITRHKGLRPEMRNKKIVSPETTVTRAMTDSLGTFMMMVPPGYCYDVLVDSLVGGIPFYQEDAFCAKPHTNMTLSIVLNAIELNRIFTLDDVQFETGKSRLKGPSQPPLEQALTFLAVNPTVNVAVVGNTDSLGNPETNQKLSEERARIVADWLIAHGVAKGRLETFGNGDRSPVASNDTENGRAKNRRVVIAISKK